MKAFVLVALFLCTPTANFSQVPGGQWEGSLKLGAGRNAPTLHLRLELVTADSASYGVLYTRGVDRDDLFGCDYFLMGGPAGNNLQLRAVEVKRALQVGPEACANFNYLQIATMPGNDSVGNARWYWMDGSYRNLLLRRTDSVVSASALEDMEDYFRRRHEFYDSLGLRLPPVERWQRIVYRLATTAPEILVEIAATPGSTGDTVSVYLNETLVVQPRSITQIPFRMRVQLPADSEQQLNIVNESVTKNRIPLRLHVVEKGAGTWLDVETTGTRHATLLLLRKNE